MIFESLLKYYCMLVHDACPATLVLIHTECMFCLLQRLLLKQLTIEHHLKVRGCSYHPNYPTVEWEYIPLIRDNVIISPNNI